jgi:SNF2 family DNA or RNA helicase
MLFIDRFWNHSKNVQCQDRLNRPGAEIHDSITIWRLEADHAVDRLVDLTVREKAMLGEAIEDEEWSQRGLA